MHDNIPCAEFPGVIDGAQSMNLSAFSFFGSNCSAFVAVWGGINAGGVQAQTADVSIAGSGDVTANATQTADVSIMGSGNVQLSGGAKCKISKAGSGNVSCS